MNIFNLYKSQVIYAIQAAYQISQEQVAQIALEAPNDPANGDLSTNAALILAKTLGKPPREIAGEIADRIRIMEDFASVEVAGPGFINIRLANKVWYKLLGSVIELTSDYGRSQVGGSKLVHLEFVSANPTGPMHVGHTRGAIVGDALANLLEYSGHQVVREYYINDAGGQIEILAQSLYIRYQQQCGVEVSLPEGCYPGDYLIDLARDIHKEYGASLLDMGDEECRALLAEKAITRMMEIIKTDLAKLGVRHDVFRSEKDDIRATGKLTEMLELLRAKGALYMGTLEAPKGQMKEDWEPKEQLLFRATAFDDDTDRAIQRSDGTFTYFAADVAYHLDKIQRGFSEMVLLLGADHSGYYKRLQAAVSALSDNSAHVFVVINQLVNLLEDGKVFKMSKRAGTYISVSDILEIIDRDILRFVMLTRKADTILDLDFVKAKQQSKDNPVFYVQYAYVRGLSVMIKAKEAGIVSDGGTDYTLLADPAELKLLKKIAQYPKAVESAALTREPHRIPYYLYDLATEFHSLWSKGTDEPGLRFVIPESRELTKARCTLVQATIEVLKSGMVLMGVTPLEKM